MGKSNSTTQTNQALQPYSGAYQNLLGEAEGTASQPLQQYQGQVVAPFNQTQESGFNVASNAAGASGYDTAQPYYAQAQTDFGNATTPLWDQTQQFSPQNVSQYESPYTQQVVGTTEQQENLQNAQQQQQVEGSAAAAGAFGGDRQAVAQSQLAGQQQTAEAPVIAGLENQGYSQAEGELNTEQQAQLGANEANSWLNSQAAFGESNLGTTAQNAAFTGAGELESTGGEQQQLAQEQANVPYEQFEQQQAYPFQTESWLGNLETDLGGAAGSTSTTQQDSSLLSQIFGGLESGAGILGETGAFGSNGYLTGSGSSGGDSTYTGTGAYGTPTAQSSYYAPEIPVEQNYSGLSSQIPSIARGGIVVPFKHRGKGIAHRDAGGAMPIPGQPISGLMPQSPSSIPDVDVSFIPNESMHAMDPLKANAHPAQSGSGSGGGIGSLIGPISSMAAMFKGGGIKGHYDDGGLTTPDNALQPGNDNPQDHAITMTGTNGSHMPYPNISYTPSKPVDTWTQEQANSPWEALIAAGGETLASGNIGRGINAGLKSYQGARETANKAQQEAGKQTDEGNYKQADIEMGADRLWNEADEARARMDEADKFHADEVGYQNAQLSFETANAAANRKIEQEKVGIEAANAGAGRYQWQPGIQPDPKDPTKTITGMWRLPTKGGEAPTFLPGDQLAGKASTGDATDPATVKYLADQYRITGQLPSLGMGANPMREAILKRAATDAGASGQTGADAVAQHADAKTTTQALGQLSKNRAMVESFAQTAAQNADLALGYMSKGAGPTGSPIVDRWIRSGGQNIAGDADVTNFNTALTTFKNEYAKIMSGATGAQGSTDSARHEADTLINPNMSQTQIMGGIKVMKQEMENRRRGLESQHQQLLDSLSGRAATTPTTSGAGQVTVTTQQQFDALPPKATFTWTDGKVYQKP